MRLIVYIILPAGLSFLALAAETKVKCRTCLPPCRTP